MSSSRTMLSGQTFLIVDDDVACVRMTTLILENHGATVHSAYNGRQALTVVETTPLHMILSDLLMPEMDGWELIERLKESSHWRSIPVIAVTASYLDAGDNIRAVDAGFTDILPKPITIGSLLKVITARRG